MNKLKNNNLDFMGFVILDKTPKFNLLSLDNIKYIGRVLFKKNRGPQSLIKSLLLGLDELDYDYRYNPKYNKIKQDDVVYVTGSLEALKIVIDLKSKGKIKKIIAGPTLVVTPDDHGGIIKDENIDLYLVPSTWTRDFYVSFGDNVLNKKLRIWPAGVDLPNKLDAKRDFSCIIYNKVPDFTLLAKVERYLVEKNISINKINYGKYNINDYFNLLKKSSFMIHFSEVESQGIALLEAWAHDIPTLVWDSESYTFEKINKTISGKVSAPYLNDACGIFFRENNYREKIDYFIANLDYFHPRNYVKNNFTNKICAKNFLNLINN